MRVLVTGAGGFIGRSTTEALLAAGHDVCALHRPGRNTPEPPEEDGDSGSRSHVVRGDLDGRAHAEEVFAASRPEAVVHLAWYTNPTDATHEVWPNIASLQSTLALLGVARESGCRRVVLGGSCLEHAGGSFAAASPYAVTKRAAHAVADLVPPNDLRIACAHIFWVYGPYEDPRRAVPTIVRSLLQGTKVDVTDGTQLREYLHVADVAAALRAVLESDLTGRVDVATGQPIALREVFEAIEASVGRRGLLRWGARPAGPGDSYEVESDLRALRSLGTWRPRYSLSTGIADTVSWWRSALAADTAPRGASAAAERARR